MTWKRVSQFALAVAVLGVLAFSAGADWYGGTAVMSTGTGTTTTTTHHGH